MTFGGGQGAGGEQFDLNSTLETENSPEGTGRGWSEELKTPGGVVTEKMPGGIGGNPRGQENAFALEKKASWGR